MSLLKRTTLQSGFVSGGKPVVWTSPPLATFLWTTANQFRGSLVTVPARMLLTGFRIRPTVQSGNISIAIFNPAGTSRLATTGAVACPAAGANATLSVLANVALGPGAYFVGMSCDNTVATFVASNSTQAQVFGGAATSTAHPAPASVTADDSSGGSVPCIGLIAA